jgi:WD40 repeat protein
MGTSASSSVKSTSLGGTSFDEFQAYAKENEVPIEMVDLRATFEKYTEKDTGLISVETVAEWKLKTDVFLTHDWGIDELERNNHDRVAAVNRGLKSEGFVTWFDSDRMTGDVVDQMVAGINSCSVVVVFITQRYMNKVNGRNPHDHCRKEFKYACHTKSSINMIPVVMEPRMKDNNENWKDVVKFELGNILYVDFSSDNDFQAAIQQLKAEIFRRTNPLWVLKKLPFVSPNNNLGSTPLLPLVLPVKPATPPMRSTTDADHLMITQMSSWFNTVGVSSSMARDYANILVEKNVGTIAKLQRKLIKNSNYLEETGVFDEDDIMDIKVELRKLLTPGQASVETIGLTAKKKENDEENPVAIDAENVPMPQYLPEISSESHAGNVLSLSWDPVSNRIASGSNDDTIKIWDGKSLELSNTLHGHSSYILSVAWNHDGSKLASGSNDKTVKVWHGQSGQLLKTLTGHSDTILSVTWSYNSAQIVSGSEDKTIKIWDGTTGELLTTLTGHSNSVDSVSCSHVDSHIVSGSRDTTIKIWDAVKGTLLRTLTEHSGRVRSVSWNHEGGKIVSCSADETVRVWNAYSGELINSLAADVNFVAWSYDDQKIASCSWDEQKIWNAITGKSLNTIQLSTGAKIVAWSPDDTRVVCDEGRNLRTFSFPDKKGGIGYKGKDSSTEITEKPPTQQLSSECHSNTVYSLSWNHVGSRIASGSWDKTIKIWNGRTLELLRTLEGHSGYVYSVDWNHDDRRLISGSADTTIKIWDGLSGELLKTLEGHSSSVYSVAWNPVDSRIVSGSVDKTIKIWNGITGVLMKTLDSHSKSVTSVAWNHDGISILSRSDDTTIKIWDSSNGNVLKTLSDGLLATVQSVVWNSDSSKFASCSFDKTVRIWNADTGDLLSSLEGHLEVVNWITWSHDDRKIASSSWNERKLLIWDALTGKSLISVQLPEGALGLTWSPDDTHIVCDQGTHIKSIFISVNLNPV